VGLLLAELGAELALGSLGLRAVDFFWVEGSSFFFKNKWSVKTANSTAIQFL
jgi:hypothetical protein